MGNYREKNYKTGFYVALENSKLQSKIENIELSQPPLDSTPIGANFFDQIWIRLLLVQKHLTKIHQQRNTQHGNKNHQNSTYQRILIQTQIRQTPHQAILIHPVIAIINTEDFIIRRRNGN